MRHQTGILLGSQDIFEGTLLQNITLGNEHISITEVSQLADMVGLSAFVQSSKQGYDTLLLPVGNKLSNRVRKNILLMRALLGHQRLLLLEEPFDHLEEPFKNNTILYISQNKNVTAIIASQDEKLEKYCDQVLLLNRQGELTD